MGVGRNICLLAVKTFSSKTFMNGLINYFMKRLKKKVSFESNQYVKTFDKTKPSNELSKTTTEAIMTIKQPVKQLPTPPSPALAPVVKQPPPDNKIRGDMSIIKKSPDKTPVSVSKKSLIKSLSKSPVKSLTKSPVKSVTKSPKKTKKSPTRANKNK